MAQPLGSDLKHPCRDLLRSRAGWSARAGIQHFYEFDMDSNEEISEAEAKKSSLLRSHFEQVDNNGNGQIDRAEFSAFEIRISD